MPQNRELHPQGVGDPLERELGRVIGTEHRRGDQPAHRGDEHQTPARGAQARQGRLGDGHLADDVDVELTAQLGRGHRLERSGDDHAGVVDHGVEPVRQRVLERGDLLRVVMSTVTEVTRSGWAVRRGSASSARRTPATTSQSAAASRCAAAAPIPRAAPVTRTVGIG
jgi:hypothetical protein